MAIFSMLFGKKKSPAAPAPAPTPAPKITTTTTQKTTPTTGQGFEEEIMRKKGQRRTARILTSTFGVPGDARVTGKTLLGQ
jgi:hypothetical protein